MSDGKIRLRAETMELDNNNNIVRSLVSENAELTLEDAKAAIIACKQLSNGKKLPIFVDLTDIKSMNREARLYYGGVETAEVVTAIALFTPSSVSKMIGNFLIGLNKMVAPAKLFSSEEKALLWLKEYQDE